VIKTFQLLTIDKIKIQFTTKKMELQALIVDNGSSMLRGGLAGDDSPRIDIPTVIGHPKTPLHTTRIGEEAISWRSILNLEYSIHHDGVITDWDNMIKIWTILFRDRLELDPTCHHILLTDSSGTSQKEKMTLSMFETMNVPGLQFISQARSSLYATCRTTGAVLASGNGVTHVVSFVEGFEVEDATLAVDVGGRDVTNYMVELLRLRGHRFESDCERSVIADLKEDLCVVSENYEQEPIVETSYELPDGTVIQLGKEIFQCAEVLFQPNVFGFRGDGIHNTLVKSIELCDIDKYKNIVLSGGNTMFKGLSDRLAKEVSDMSNVRVKMVVPPNRNYSAWIGGSILASISSFQEMWITKQEYNEVGVGILDRKIHEGKI